jgi:hypothetical protein
MACGGCISSSRQDFGNTTPAEADAALRAVMDCAKQSVGSVDDGRSDASTVALALAQHCFSEYQNSINTFADVQLRNDAQRRSFLAKRNSVSGRIEFFLPVVMEHRQRAK